MIAFARFCLGGLAAGLAACSAAPRDAAVEEVDPAVAMALMAPLLADPDLISVDRRYAVYADPGPLDAAIPPDDFAPSTVAAARAEARRIAGGTTPPELGGGGACRGCQAPFVDERAAMLGNACSAQLKPGLEWSLRLPAAVPVYPRSHLREAAGVDQPPCRFYAASFSAPVQAGEVLRFYRAVAAGNGFALTAAGPEAFIGSKGPQRIGVVVRQGPGGFAQYDVLVAG